MLREKTNIWRAKKIHGKTRHKYGERRHLAIRLLK
jgi:hypothetical protein